ncbi:hypothetical protein L842_1777 [Mycobacterium intracellulare MIN_052511_1280]|nr:hypothetical protein L842_1777 [Mycobacterium intracellulare MIN_052511_1280]
MKSAAAGASVDILTYAKAIAVEGEVPHCQSRFSRVDSFRSGLTSV